MMDVPLSRHGRAGREKILLLCCKSNHDHSVVQLVAQLPYRLCYNSYNIALCGTEIVTLSFINGKEKEL
jgi:hypothetical protein